MTVFRSIRWRTAVAFVVLIAAAIGGLSIYVSHSFRDSFQANVRAQLVDEASLVGDSSISYFAAGQTAGLADLADRLGGRIDARVTIIDKDGVVWGDSFEDPAGMENLRDRPEVIEALATGVGSSTRRSGSVGQQMLYVAVPVSVDGEVVGIARVALPLTAMNSYLSSMNRTVIAGSLVAAAIAIALAFQISRMTVGPLKELTQMSSRIADGELEQRINVATHDEVGDLARAFNRMAARLREMVAALTSQRDTLTAVLCTMEDGIFVLDGEASIATFNPTACRLLGLAAEGLEGRSFVEAVHDYELADIVQRCLKTRQAQSGSVEISNRRLVRVTAAPLEGQPGCLVLLQDLTEIRRLERTRRDFMANISHELRTPAASLKAIAETLEDGALDDPVLARDFLGRMNAEVDRLTQVIQELGQLSRIESGAAPMLKEPFDLADTVRAAANRLEPQAGRAGLKLHLELPVHLPAALGDRERIEQVLMNLLHNAIKFTPAGGSVTLSAGAGRDGIQVTVSDTGVGIAPEDLPRVFERFYKADRARSGGGTGLGLAVAKHIVEAHGGRIWAESTEGKGSTFRFTLPLAPRG